MRFPLLGKDGIAVLVQARSRARLKYLAPRLETLTQLES
jgi:hypothetical protein